MGTVVTGLLQNADTHALCQALEKAGLSLDPLQVVEPDDSAEPIARAPIGVELMTGDRATSVPGLNSGVGSAYFRNESLEDRLADLRVPDSEMANYVEALERGKTVVAYFAKPETVESAEAAFRSASLANVRIF